MPTIFFWVALANDLRGTIEESLSIGNIFLGSSANFKDLTPNNDNNVSFDQYRQLSLCNYI